MADKPPVIPQAARPRKRMTRAKRLEEMLLLAEQILVEEGADALSVSRIAEDMGVARTVVYSHFPNTSALIFAIIERHWRDLDARFAKIDAAAPFPERLRQFASIYIGDNTYARLRLKRLLFAAAREETVRAEQRRRQDLRVQLWSKALRDAYGLPNAKADMAAAMALESLAAIGASARPGQSAKDQAVDLYVSAVMGMIAAIS